MLFRSGPDVQGLKQKSYHKRRGWKTTRQVAEEEQAKVIEIVNKAIEKALR